MKNSHSMENLIECKVCNKVTSRLYLKEIEKVMIHLVIFFFSFLSSYILKIISRNTWGGITEKDLSVAQNVERFSYT